MALDLNEAQKRYLLDPNSDASRAWLRSNADEDRRTGRTTALALHYLSVAWENPGTFIKPEDHTLVLDGKRWLLTLITQHAKDLNCNEFLEFKSDSFRVVPAENPWKAAKLRVAQATMRL